MIVFHFPGEWLLSSSSRVVRVWSQRFLHQKWTSWGGSHEQKGTGKRLLLFISYLFVYISDIINPHPVKLENEQQIPASKLEFPFIYDDFTQIISHIF